MECLGWTEESGNKDREPGKAKCWLYSTRRETRATSVIKGEFTTVNHPGHHRGAVG